MECGCFLQIKDKDINEDAYRGHLEDGDSINFKKRENYEFSYINITHNYYIPNSVKGKNVIIHSHFRSLGLIAMFALTIEIQSHIYVFSIN